MMTTEPKLLDWEKGRGFFCANCGANEGELLAEAKRQHKTFMLDVLGPGRHGVMMCMTGRAEEWVNDLMDDIENMQRIIRTKLAEKMMEDLRDWLKATGIELSEPQERILGWLEANPERLCLPKGHPARVPGHVTSTDRVAFDAWFAATLGITDDEEENR